jgi:MFS family permease
MSTPSARPPESSPLDPSPPAGEPRAWILLGLLMLISFSHLFHRVGLGTFTGELRSRWGYSEVQVGWILASFLLTYTVAMTPGGWLADRIGTRRTLLIVSAGTGVFGALIGGAEWLGLGSGLAAAWMVSVLGCMGICAAPNFPSTSRTVSAWFRPERQVLGNALVTAAAIGGAAAASPVLTGLAHLTWPVAFAFTGAFGLCIAVFWAGLGRESPRGTSLADAARAPLDWSRFLGHRGIVCLSLSYGCLGYSQYVFFTWLNNYFKEVLRYDAADSAWYTSIPILGMMVSTPIGGVACSVLAQRKGIRRVFPLCSLVFMICSALSLATGALRRESGPTEIVIWFTLACAFIGMAEGPFWTTAARLGGKFAATSGGVVNTGGNLGGLIAIPLSAFIASETAVEGDPAHGWTVALVTSSIVIGVGGLLWLGVDPEDRYGEGA